MNIGTFIGIFLLLIVVIVILSSIKIVNTGSVCFGRKVWSVS